ncbi:MAG: 3-deoxy-manno-octulosonate cytidylyltransferase [Pseudomonadota bacterium]
MSFSVVIPARYASTRLPAKALEDIHGKPMVQRVWEQASLSAADEVIVATDDQRILDAVQLAGARGLMTSADHPTGTDRLHEVAAAQHWPDEHIVVNVQGDEPLIPPAVIDQVAVNLAEHRDAGIATLCEPIVSAEDLLSPNVVKVVMGEDSIARYFSRAPVPWPRDAFARHRRQLPDSDACWFRHIGIYAYRVGFLRRFVAWPSAPMEKLEQLEQLRALHHGVMIHVAQACCEVPAGVDTQTDLEAVRKAIKGAGA